MGQRIQQVLMLINDKSVLHQQQQGYEMGSRGKKETNEGTSNTWLPGQQEIMDPHKSGARNNGIGEKVAARCPRGESRYDVCVLRPARTTWTNIDAPSIGSKWRFT